MESRKHQNHNIHNYYNHNNNNLNYNNYNNYNNSIIDEEYNYPTEEELYRIKNMKNNEINKINNNINNSNDEIPFDDDTDENIIVNKPNDYNSKIKLKNLYINNPNNINSINFSNNKENEIEIKKIDSHRIKVGNNEFEDLTKEAREMQNKEAFEKKILGIYGTERKEVQQEKKPFFERVGEFIENHEEGILTVIDGIGCILLHGPSIVRTINRLDRWIDNIGNNDNNEENRQNADYNIINEVGLQNKERDLTTILKFLPVWEVRQNKKSDNNNNCVVCLTEFEIGDIISALPCCHVFHTKCIENWLQKELTCPVCKFEVTLSSIIGQFNN